MAKPLLVLALSILYTTWVSLDVVEASGPWCLACNAFHPAICQSVVKCNEDETCFTEKSRSNTNADAYITECKQITDCNKRTKRASSRATLCSECCNGTICNKDGCGAPDLQTPGRLFCLKCDFVQQPYDCDKIELCSRDSSCFLQQDTRLSQHFYKVGCADKNTCAASNNNLAAGEPLCCDSNLCNSNPAGVDPALYTTTPIPTTRKPSPATAMFDKNVFLYNVTHAPNETLDLVCHVAGGPVPTVTWTFNNGSGAVPVKNGVLSTDQNGDSILSIPSPGISDSGIYNCKAENRNGKDSDDIGVTILSPPEILGDLNETAEADFQENVVLFCNVSMDNSTTVAWEIPPGVQSYSVGPDNILTLFNVHEENTGDYRCVANNSDGQTVKTVHLQVNSTASIKSSAPCTCPTVPTVTCAQVSASNSATTLSSPTQVSTPFATTLFSKTSAQSTTSSSSSILTTHTTGFTSVASASRASPPTPSTSSSISTSSSTSAFTTLPSSSSSSITRTGLISVASPSYGATTTQTNHIFNQFQELQANGVNVLQCPTPGLTAPIIQWRRLVQDFNRSDSAFVDTYHGVLTIVNKMSVLMTGVYQCEDAGKPRGQLVIYKKLVSAVDCNKVFGDYSRTPGVVIRVSCHTCANPLGLRPTMTLHVNDFICESAIAKGLIPDRGGDVTYVLKQFGEVALLDENVGDFVM